jgi:SpoVK/Ycf46/Vps4 family AAA+-type ATPase
VIVATTGLPCVYMLCDRGPGDELGEAFTKAARLAPCILVFEDIDRMLKDGDGMSYFLNMMDGFRTNDGVLTLATANHPEEMDVALLQRPSRFDRVWRIGDPDEACRGEYLARLFGGHLSQAELLALARETEGLSYAFLKELYLSSAHAAAQAARDTVDAGLARDVLEMLRRQRDEASRGFDVETIGFLPPVDDE